MNGTIEEAYSPYHYNGTAEEFQTQIDNGDVSENYKNMSDMFFKTLVLLASGQALYTLFNLANNFIAYCECKSLPRSVTIPLGSAYAVIQAYRLAGFLALMASAFTHEGSVCRGDYLETYPATYSDNFMYVDEKKGKFLFAWAIVCIAMVLLYVALIVFTFLLVAYERFECLKDCLVSILKFTSPSIAKAVRHAEHIKKAASMAGVSVAGKPSKRRSFFGINY